MQSVPRDLEALSGSASNYHSHRPSHSEATDSASPRDASQLLSRGDSARSASVARDSVGVQNEEVENLNAQSSPPDPDNIRHSGKSQRSPTHNMPAAKRDLVPNAADDAIGNGPGTRRSGVHSPFPRTRFGLNKTEKKRRTLPTDYKQKYTEDPPYKELDPEARVWHVYNDESEIFDHDMMVEANDNLDILLVFAGLFSSVLTTFVTQTSQALSQDNTAVSNSILLELVALQRAQANGTSLEAIPHADTSFTVALSDVWVNGLWFTSLMLSLTTALLAVLAKQWLRQYSSFIAGSARERALIRQFRYTCFNKWGVQLIIGFLPAILHLSLFLFMVGLAVFLYALNHAMATIVACIAGSLFGAYIVTNVLPIFAIGCPYRTPLAPLLYSFIHGSGRDIFLFSLAVIKYIPTAVHIFVQNTLASIGLLGNNYIQISRKQPFRYERPDEKTLRQAERTYVESHQTTWTNFALSWLASVTSDSSAQAILVEALGIAKASKPLNVKPLLAAFEQQWKSIFSADTAFDEMQFGRLIRSTIVQSDDYKIIMWSHLPTTPISVQDPAIILAIAACCKTPTFHWGDESLVLPPHHTFNFVLEHYTLFDGLAVPMWMWLSICVQAVVWEQVLLLPPSSLAQRDPEALWYATLSAVSIGNTYNTTLERNWMSAWFQQRLISNDLRRAVDAVAQTAAYGILYSSRYDPVSLGVFLAVIRDGRSFDVFSQVIPSSPPWSSLDDIVADPSQHISHPGSSHSLRTLSATTPQSSPCPPQLPVSLQNDSAGEALPNDAASSYALRDLGGDSSALRTSRDRDLSRP